jgi:hypothetical protein
MKTKLVLTHLVAASLGFWASEALRYFSQHAPVRHRPGVLIEGRFPQ